MRPRAQVTLHALVLAAGLAMMPLALGIEAPPADASPVGWLLALLALTVGPPFVAIAATAPLLQAWYARVRAGYADGKNPYVLYAASNLGSFLALMSYP
ncbi:MAG: spermidine synthase, partial [Planctomycetes bacterium]|nr:spermidine synthase [Planctomycetota bacterium]